MSLEMKAYFVRDHKARYRFFSDEPVKEIEVHFSRLQKIWAAARTKLLLLPKKILAQERAFEQTGCGEAGEIQIFHSGHYDERRIRSKFNFFLQKQRSKHVAFLIGETLLLPISGLMALVPGPNVFFGVLALIMITQWQALRGINGLLRKEQRFHESRLWGEWEEAVSEGKSDEFSRLLSRLEETFRLSDLGKILWK